MLVRGSKKIWNLVASFLEYLIKRQWLLWTLVPFIKRNEKLLFSHNEAAGRVTSLCLLQQWSPNLSSRGRGNGCVRMAGAFTCMRISIYASGRHSWVCKCPPLKQMELSTYLLLHGPVPNGPQPKGWGPLLNQIPLMGSKTFTPLFMHHQILLSYLVSTFLRPWEFRLVKTGGVYNISDNPFKKQSCPGQKSDSCKARHWFSK